MLAEQSTCIIQETPSYPTLALRCTGAAAVVKNAHLGTKGR